MDRVTIVGCCGSGKTHLALRLADRLTVPVTHLDTIYYDADRNILPREDFEARQQSLVAQPRWIIEGNYAATLPVRLAASDTILLLDLPTLSCVRGVVERRLRSGGNRPCGGAVDDAGQPDATDSESGRVGLNGPASWGNSSYMLTYRRAVLPRIEAMIEEHGRGAEVIRLRSRRAVDQFARGAAHSRS